MHRKLLIGKMIGVLTVLLVLFMAAGVAEAEKKSGNWKYVLQDDGAIITGYVKKPKGKLTIPNKLGKQTVIAIGKAAFMNCDRLSGVTIPGSVTSIGDNAFYGCGGLASVTIEEGVTVIGMGAFINCKSLADVTIPGSVTSIGESAFRGCEGLTGVTIEEGVTAIGMGAFWDCSLLSGVIIPGSVTSIGQNAFRNCINLAGVTIPSSVTSIGKEAFKNCINLAGVTIPGSATSIGEEAFSGCDGLAGVTIEEGVTAIGKGAFWACLSLTQVTLPASVSSIECNPFELCNITSFTVAPENPVFESIDGVLFDKQRKMLVSYPRAKAGTAYAIPDGVVSIGEGAFSSCYKTSELTSVTIPESVTDIGDYAFFMCDITSVTLSEGLDRIGKGAFKYCRKLPSLTIPKSVTEINSDAFLDCYKLTLSVKSGFAEKFAKVVGISYIRDADSYETTDESSDVIGDRLTFGSYQGKAIEWRVLAAEENRVLVISEEILAAQPYNTQWESVTWETSTLRQWLNNDFYYAAFTEAERARILETTVVNGEYDPYSDSDAEGGSSTLDRIFLLSVEEAEEYFVDRYTRIARPTAYAMSRGVVAYENGAGCWWLRSPGAYSTDAAFVNAGGGFGGGDYVSRDDGGVRPALWLNP